LKLQPRRRIGRAREKAREIGTKEEGRGRNESWNNSNPE